jgi:uncharacterized protein (TIGR03663 family)
MHGDEANQAHRFELLLNTQTFKYEPIDYHGPTLYFMTLPFAWIMGLDQFEMSTKTFFRSVPVFFSMLMALGSLLFIKQLGKIGVLALALFIMTSPAMVYYSTYYIQETLLICFSLAFIASLWNYLNRPSFLWAMMSGGALGLMQATKETFILSMAALCLSLILAKKLNPHWRTSAHFKKHLIYAGLTAITISIIFYSSFFSNAKGPLDSLTAFTHQIQRGLGNTEFKEQYTSGIAHSKSSSYYLETLFGDYPKKVSSTLKSILRNSPDRSITEIIFFILPFLGLFYLKRQSKFFCHAYWVSLSYSLALMVIYSLIPYKTPWCLLSFLLGFMFVSALSVNFILLDWRLHRSKAFALLSLILIIDLTRQAALINDENFCVTDKNPYAYVQPYYDVENLSNRIHQFAELDGRDRDMPIHFLTNDYWPMPWYLKRYNKIGYWEKQEPNLDFNNCPVVITTPDRTQLITKLEKTHTSEYRGRMPGYHYLVFYKNELWNRFHESL